MNTRETRPVNISFPFSLYFEQLFSHDTYVRFINPFSFWRQYRIKHLESCRELNTVQYLDRCHQLEWRLGSPKGLASCDATLGPLGRAYPSGSLKLPHSGISENSLKRSTHSTSFDQQTSNRIFVLQPSIELKYRGVTYRTTQIVSVNTNSIKIEPDSIKPNNSAQPANPNNTNAPENFGRN